MNVLLLYFVYIYDMWLNSKKLHDKNDIYLPGISFLEIKISKVSFVKHLAFL